MVQDSVVLLPSCLATSFTIISVGGRGGSVEKRSYSNPGPHALRAFKLVLTYDINVDSLGELLIVNSKNTGEVHVVSWCV